MSPSTAILLADFLSVVSWIIIARVLLSWVVRDPANPIVRVIGTLTDPLMRPLSRFLTVGGIDLSPIAVLFLINMAKRALLSGAA